ncbi:RNA polymerase sigma factor [Microbacterium sp. ZW T5_56]|uniref:RNA polymerase sigma factor n=1 Tax=Microbacterium sp. ZW T5_56 TaxID=3378081 RepID=UPI003853C647
MNTDSEILSRSQDEPGAFAELFERHAVAIGGYARRRVGADAVDDVLSETFLIAFRRRSTFDGEATSARPWLLGIATRVIHRLRRIEARQWRAGFGEAETVSSHESRADAQLDAESALRRLAPRIAALSQRERDVLFLYAWEELTYEQIASALSIPVGTVRSRLSRVRQKLGPPDSRGPGRVTWIAKEEANVVGR